MIEEDPTAGAAPGIGQPLTALGDALDQLIAGLDADLLGAIGDDQLLDFTRGFEQIRNRMSLVDQEVVTACETTGLPRRLAHCGTARLLCDTLLIEPGEAHRRVRATHALRGATTMLGERLQAQRPELAEAVAAGTVPPGNADRVIRALDELDRLPWTEPDQISQIEHDLIQPARECTPKDLQQVIDHLTDLINPDGTLADDQAHETQRSLYCWQGRDSAWHLQGRLTPTLGAKLSAILEPLAAPQNSDDGPDPRSRGQRMHDALDEAVSRLLQDGDTPGWGGTPATVIVTIDYQQLLGRFGRGRFADGTSVSPETIMKLANQADIVPTVFAPSGQVLWLGRSKRIADKNQTAALVARDAGCSFPGCDRAPYWCQRHHITSWADGGLTDIDNLTLLCLFHHGHFEELGWQCRMINGLPYWIPPRWINREQKPRLNKRIQIRHQPETATG